MPILYFVLSNEGEQKSSPKTYFSKHKHTGKLFPVPFPATIYLFFTKLIPFSFLSYYNTGVRYGGIMYETLE